MSHYKKFTLDAIRMVSFVDLNISFMKLSKIFFLHSTALLWSNLLHVKSLHNFTFQWKKNYQLHLCMNYLEISTLYESHATLLG